MSSSTETGSPCGRLSRRLSGDGARRVLTYTYKLEGDTLQGTFEKNQDGPISNPATIKLVQIEHAARGNSMTDTDVHHF
jgi:hypothetical protein